MKKFACDHGLTRRIVHLGVFSILVALLAAIAAAPQATLAQSPTEECAAIDMTYVDKLDSIPDLDNEPNPLEYQGTTEGGLQVTVIWNKIQGQSGEIISISPSDFFDAYVAKWGNGGGLSHITFCEGSDPTSTVPPPTATSTVPPPTATSTVPPPTATATIPANTATPTDPANTVTPTDPANTATPTDPANTATPTDPANTATPTDPSSPTPTTTKATSTIDPTATSTQPVNTLPTTGSNSGGPGGTNLMLLLVASSVLFISATVLVQRGWSRKQ